LVETKSIIITYTPDKFNPRHFFSLNALSKMFSVLNNGKIHLRNGNSQFHLALKPSIIMIIGMPGIELFSIT